MNMSEGPPAWVEYESGPQASDFHECTSPTVLHWNYRGFTEFPIHQISGEEADITDIYLKENLISRVPSDICRLENLESLYLTGNDIAELPREISRLRSLKCLDVSGNRLRAIPDEIGDVRGLKFLILDENELRELPLRLSELSALRYLSVCDNNLEWLPQKPVYNYHHCEFRFWRNPKLKTIPYALWYHMLSGQQTRSLNLGCLSNKDEPMCNISRCVINVIQDSKELKIFVKCPPVYKKVLNYSVMPPSLYELSKRRFFGLIFDTTKCLNQVYYNNNLFYKYGDDNNNLSNLQEYFDEINIGEDIHKDVNGNDTNFKFKKEDKRVKRKKILLFPGDIIDDYFSFLPIFIKKEIRNGPVSKCDNSFCKKPIFDYVYYEFCLGKIILIGGSENVILNATFCSKQCSDLWKRGREVLQWTCVENLPAI